MSDHRLPNIAEWCVLQKLVRIQSKNGWQYNGNERDHNNAGNNGTLLLLQEMNCTKNARLDTEAFCY